MRKALSIFIALLPLALFGQNALFPVQSPINYNWGYVNELGEHVTSCVYSKAYNFSDGLGRVRINGKYGFVDASGTLVIPATFTEAEDFYDGMAKICINGKYCFIDKTGAIVISPQFDEASQFSEGLASFRYSHYIYGFIDKTGEIIIPAKFHSTSRFHEGLAAACINKKWGYVDKEGNVVIPFIYDVASDFSEGLAAVEIDGKKGYINKTGEMVIPAIYWMAGNFSEGLASVSTGGYHGYIDKSGSLIIDKIFPSAFAFKDGLAVVSKDHKYGFINKNGEFVIPPVYDNAFDFNKGLGKVKDGDKLFFVDKANKLYNTEVEGRRALAIKKSLPAYLSSKFYTFEDILKRQNIEELSEDEIVKQVEAEITQWQTKGEFEPTSDWQKRVNEDTRKAKAREIGIRIVDSINTKIQSCRANYLAIQKKLIAEFCKMKSDEFKAQTMELKPYDADNRTFLISTENAGDILLPVPLDKAQKFKTDWNDIKNDVKAVYVPNGEDVSLQSVTFGEFVYDSNTKANYAMTDVNYNFKPIDVSALTYNFAGLNNDNNKIDVTTTTAANTITPQRVEPARNMVNAGDASDVDINIPAGNANDANTFAVIIANGNYQQASNVETAHNDGLMMEKYLTRTMGIPASHISTYYNATYGQIVGAVGHLEDIAQAFGRDNFNVIFYYVGHGLPDDASREAYLLPVDADPRKTSACYPLRKLYEELASLNAANVTIMIDACFSGSNYGDGMLVSQSMGAVIKPKAMAPKGRMVVMAAAQGDETAFPYTEKGHGLFTYYILKKLQESKGSVTLGELSDYVCKNVSQTSVVCNHKPQTPSVAVSPTIVDTWRNLYFGK